MYNIDSINFEMKGIVVMCLIAVAAAKPAVKEESLVDKFIVALRDCVDVNTMVCLKEKAMKYTENLAMSKELNLVDGVTLTRAGSPRNARSYEALPDEPKARELQVDKRIMDNVVDFLESHVLQLRMPKFLEEDNEVEEEGRGKKKKKLKKLLPLLALLKLKIAALIPLFLGIIAFAVFKAYLLGKIAFLAAALSSVKKLLEKKGGGGGGGWESSGHDDHGGGGWESSGGWGRSQTHGYPDAQSIAYAAHAKQA